MQSRPIVAVCLVVAIAALVLVAVFSGNDTPAALTTGASATKPSGSVQPAMSSVGGAVATLHAASSSSDTPDEGATATGGHTGPGQSRPATERPVREGSLFRRDIAKFFALAPDNIKFRDLARHVDLNILDEEIVAKQRVVVEEIVGRNKRLITAARHDRMDKRHAILKGLDRKEALTELSLDLLDPATRKVILAKAKQSVQTFQGYMESRRKAGIEVPTSPNSKGTELKSAILSTLRSNAKDLVPDASAFLIHHGKLFVAKDAQMADLADASERVTSAKRLFLYETLGWFVEEGLTTPSRATQVAEKFESWMETS